MMNEYTPIIGLEIHTELKTKTKMFCDSLNDPEEKHPNINICPVCTGQPGTLPTINKKAIEAILKIGMALKGDIPQFSKFDRKNYFYPDLPKGYQISQYDLPLIFGGSLNGIRLRRIHLEEDTGRLLHMTNNNDDDRKTASHGHSKKSSFVDFNRAGVPLMELVTEPDIKNADQAVEFAKELQLILRYLGISDADMEKGQMRVEANVSLSKMENATSDMILGTKVEVKNINSFKAVHDAIEYEIERQEEILEGGGKVVQETRGWDANKGKTVSQRLKEEAHDYRYFPEPDLPPLDMSKFDLAALKREIPELPQEKSIRFQKEYGLTEPQIDLLVSEPALADYFEKTVSELKEERGGKLERREIPLAVNYLTTDYRSLLTSRDSNISDSNITPENFSDLIIMLSDDFISSRTAKDLLVKMEDTGLDPREIAKQESLSQISDESQLQSVVKKVVKENPTAIADYKKGKANALQFLVGKAMAELRGRGNPELLQRLIKKAIL